MTSFPTTGRASTSADHPGTGMLPEERAWLASQDEYESMAANLIAVELPPRRLHPVLATLHKQLLDRLKRMEKLGRDAVRIAERNARLLNKASGVTRKQMAPTDYEWRRFVEDGQPLETSHKAACLRVTPGTLDRAVAILTALFLAAEKRGHAVDLAEDRSRFQVTINEAVIQVRMTERLDERLKTMQDLQPGEKLWEGEKSRRQQAC